MKLPAAIWKTANSSGMGICPPGHFMEEAELTDSTIIIDFYLDTEIYNC